MRPSPTLLLPFLALAATAQNSAKPATGTVTGHVYCADTNAPARVARVQLESFHEEAERSAGHRMRTSSGGLWIPAGGVVSTALDGSFTLANVPPGSYYVVATAEGYLSPRADADDFDNAEPQPLAGQPPLVIPKVDVQADQTASIDVRLERGAAVSGTVRFDDGSPAPETRIVLLHKNKKGEWVGSRFPGFTGRFSSETDDLGHYRISGLRDREYLLQAIFTRSDIQSGDGRSFVAHGINRSTLTIYAGDTFRRSDAVPFKLSAGDERSGEDITIPLSKLHSVSGVVTAARDGHAINAGFINISTPGDKETVADAELDSDGSFHLECVPEGTYLLQVTNPHDKKSQDLTIGKPGGGGFTFFDDKTLHQYGELEQTIKVEGDIPNLILAVPEPAKQHAAQ